MNWASNRPPPIPESPASSIPASLAGSQFSEFSEDSSCSDNEAPRDSDNEALEGLMTMSHIRPTLNEARRRRKWVIIRRTCRTTWSPTFRPHRRENQSDLLFMCLPPAASGPYTVLRRRPRLVRQHRLVIY